MNITTYPRTPRLVNHFSLGADPEFTFHHVLDGSYVFAENLGLTTMQAFGCDMAGRQAEIRAYPSKFALEVVASIADSLRWMAYARPMTQNYNWIAAAWNGKDGSGGHIHFGRKRGVISLTRDSRLLDGVTNALVQGNVLDKSLFRQRAGHTNYGKYGDIRLQTHGYEYRTLPTELASPWLTFFVLVVSKLALHEGKSGTYSFGLEKVKDLLTKYKNIDDDAAICDSALKLYGLPKDHTADFRAVWGIPVKCLSIGGNTPYYPSVIRPSERTCQELFELFTRGTQMSPRVPVATWEPRELPILFQLVQVQPHSLGHLPDVGMNLVSYRHLTSVERGGIRELTITSTFPLAQFEITRALKGIRISFVYNRESKTPSTYLHLSVPTDVVKDLRLCKLLNRVLGDPSLFPVCKASEISSLNTSHWDAVFDKQAELRGTPVCRVRGSYIQPPSRSKLRPKSIGEPPQEGDLF